MTTDAAATRPPVAVLGLGGIGGMLAAHTGAVCVGTERTVEAIRGRGLTLVEGDERIVVHPEATLRLEQPVSLLVVCVKAYDLDAALDRIAPEALDGALVLPLLNGLEHVDSIRARFQDASYKLLQACPVVAAGSIGRVSASSPEPGLVLRSPGATGTIAAASRDLDREALAARLRPLATSEIELVLRDHEREVLWEKAARLAVLAAATVASGLPLGALRDDPAWRERLRAGLEEAVAAAAADGVALAGAGQWAMIESMPPELTTSAARDAAAGRSTELDAITGSVVRAAGRVGVPVPTLERLLADAEQAGG
jgi:2-dehydropantoate 2-reductase